MATVLLDFDNSKCGKFFYYGIYMLLKLLDLLMVDSSADT